MSARGMVVRGVLAASHVRAVLFSYEPRDTDNFETPWGELSPEAQAGWERIARLLEATPPHLLVPRDPSSVPPKEPSE